MNTLDKAQDRALELIGEIGDGLRKKVPDKAVQWLETGAAIGALRAGSKVAGSFVRRNPVLVGAAVLVAGVLWYAARQRSKQRDVIEGQAQRLPPGADGQDEYGV